MEFRELEIKGVFEIVLSPHLDERGFFMRTYDAELFKKHGLHREWVQESHSRSERKGIIRGLHFQLEPYAETKLVRCIRGEIFDVAVDLRKGSKTFGKWEGIILSEENRKMLLIPRGFAHGFCTLTDISEVVYKVDSVYSPEHERGLIWNDPDLNIDWPEPNPVLSQKDKQNITLKQFMEHG
ncbi:MAG TPA: dTDP-4-dehydrorhamnose 3,5-epimerase [Bacteroidales bacterium]|jgi:dTDP-4-dehydrorhamnose 3,5-epimerase|nr:dTDP-4-dehydrorhamnose 3,5-epimerase [Bacteroidales bacterium]HNR40756.1 dTDP-4-dehydrorhamnose 3,5-epimerase [Bacteroidales bacterium]